MNGQYRRRATEAFATLIVVALGLRLVLWLVVPVVPRLIVLGAVGTVLLIAVSRR